LSIAPADDVLDASAAWAWLQQNRPHGLHCRGLSVYAISTHLVEISGGAGSADLSRDEFEREFRESWFRPLDTADV